jgi:hypothetical protein
MDLDFCELFSPLDFFGQGGTLGRASAGWHRVADSPVWDSAVSGIQQSDSPVQDSAVGFTSMIHQCAQCARLEADPRVGTSESGAQPPVGRTKNISHVLCFDVVSGSLPRKRDWRTFIFVHFRRLRSRRATLGCHRATAPPRHCPAAPLHHCPATACSYRMQTDQTSTPPCRRRSHTSRAMHHAWSASVHAACCPPGYHHRRQHHSAPGTRILSHVRLSGTQCV